MTQSATPPISPSISELISERIRDLRERAGLSRGELADAAREHGAPGNFTANVIGFLERGRRGLGVDELFALAAALEVTPLELLGDAAAATVGDNQAAVLSCPTCDNSEPGPVEQVVRQDMARLEPMADLEHTLAATAIRLAGGIDQARGEEAVQLPRLTRELRSVVKQLAEGRTPGDDDDGDLDDLDKPDPALDPAGD